ncbi:bifunctional 5,10-methylene-tetrahydrofolate dehydrogenase/5,10-methylene-tetrahydrofolate cyclohydrolase [Paenibacillus sp. IB182496]|uniref:Bifunctional protein FolD n=1 Tax=Paenibacillus sabuli TaxID=2772509 RepID=A0A927BPJ8_9BACL|nr:tetrahydrofolate dehydrogenase/cyclohydrolase catalytic domain-containing protein [Paenibacillus sabuli]MBD2844361.1 bifunctional 5,10-methylene-tetrahydrofolate dehydrogenase/5,10-methylene-tetrahydrofolate cyclohydrolase [Paenibacillus sabuli]
MNKNETPTILDGTALAAELRQRVQERAEALASTGTVPTLATILVGDDPASATYVRMKANACRKAAMASRIVRLDAQTTTEELLACIAQLNRDPQVHGILLQHPVPPQIDERRAFDAIAPLKDVDGVTTLGFGQTAFGFARYPSCTPAAIMALLEHYRIDLRGRHAVVIGRSPILGKPAAMLLLERNATVTVCHSHTSELERHVGMADIVVAAVGRPRFVQGSWIKPGAAVLDAGYNPGNVGDVDYAACAARAGAITPVPGGVGPVTIAKLLEHTVAAAEAQVAET